MKRFQVLLSNSTCAATPRARPAHLHGRAVQLAPIKPRLKAPGTKRLKLKCDVLLSASAFKFNLRRYNMEESHDITMCAYPSSEYFFLFKGSVQAVVSEHKAGDGPGSMVGAYTRPLFGLT